MATTRRLRLDGRDDGLGLIECADHLDAFLSPRHDMRRFLQQLVQNFGFYKYHLVRDRGPVVPRERDSKLTVEMLQQYSLHVLLGVIDQRQRNGFRYHVNHFPLDLSLIHI